MHKTIPATLALGLLLGACSSDQPASITERTPVTDAQLETLKKAKQVEGILQKNLDRQRRHIDRQ